VEFRYTECEGDVWRPYLPITISYGSKELPIGSALVDTGSDLTLLPLAIAHTLEIELDDSKNRKIDAAGGGVFEVMPLAEAYYLHCSTTTWIPSNNVEGHSILLW